MGCNLSDCEECPSRDFCSSVDNADDEISYSDLDIYIDYEDEKPLTFE